MISADGALLMNTGAADRITIDAGSTDDTLTIAGDFSSTSLANGNVTFNSCGGTVPDLDHMTSDLNVRVTRGGLDDDAITPDSTVSNAIPPDAGPADATRTTHTCTDTGPDTKTAPGQGETGRPERDDVILNGSRDTGRSQRPVHW